MKVSISEPQSLPLPVLKHAVLFVLLYAHLYMDASSALYSKS